MNEYANALEQIAQSMQSVNFRENVAPGTVLGKTEIEPGATAVWRKSGSGQRIGNKELPDRVPLYNRITGDCSMVPPTIATKRIMESPETFTLMEPEGIQRPEPIPETCDVCLRRRNGVPRHFYSEYDLEIHYQLMHPSEHAARLRKLDEVRHREDVERQERLITAIVERLNPMKGRG